MNDDFEPNKKFSKKYRNNYNLIKQENHSTNTIPSVKDNNNNNDTIINNQSNFQTINQTSKSFTLDNKTNQRRNSRAKSRNNSKNKIPSSSMIHNMNNESSLLKNIQFLDSDNVKLREALKEINIELHEKEEALNESQKLIKKINSEYTQILNQYKSLEEEKNKLKKENEKLQKMNNNLNQILKKEEKKEKQNEKIKSELIKTKEKSNNLKGNYSNISCDFNKIEKDMKYKEIIINDLKIEGNKIVNMLQDRELLIQEYNKKISELNDTIKQKDEQLKLMLNFSKELNNENKTNIKELTKQAVKTIKVFYNSRKNEEEKNSINLIEIKNNKMNDINNAYSINDILSKNNCSFLIENAIKNDLFIPDIGINFINKEFLKENNLKTYLIKTELFSSILREFHLIQHLNDILNQINESLKNFNWQKNTEQQAKSIRSFKLLYSKIHKNLMETKKENSILKTKLNDLILYIKKLQHDFSIKTKKFKEKIEAINNQYISYISKIKNKNNNNKDKHNDESISHENKSELISELNKENDKIKNINHNLNEELKNKEEIINNLRNENNKLIKKLNSLRANPNEENYLNYISSYSSKGNNVYPKKILSNQNNLNYNKDLILYTNQVLYQSNNDFDNFNNDETLFQNINHKYFSTYKKDENKRFSNIKEMKFNSINFNSENKHFYTDYEKSNNINKNNFINLEIQIQDSFFFNSKNNLTINKFYKELNNSKINNDENINSILSAIKNFTSEISKELFIDIIKRIFNSNNILLMLNNKIGDIKNNLSLIKDNFKNNNNNKKIKPCQLLDIINEVEKLLFYLFNQLNKYNFDTQKISPFLKIIFNMVSLIAYNIPLEFNNNIYDITPITNNSNTLFNTSKTNYNNNAYSKNNVKDNILMNNNINKNKNKINIQNFHNLFYINNKIFSSSELIKYRSIYDGLGLSELISVFKEICQNFEKIILNSKFNYDTDWSDFEENNDIAKNKYSEMVTENNTYHVVNEKIFGLKKFEFNLKLFFELLKNYLVVFEIVVQQFEVNLNNNFQNKKEIENILNILYEIFEGCSYLNLNSLDDNAIFCRKIILTLLLNQKEYLLSYYI